MNERADRYLWDGGEPVDPEVAELEGHLGSLRYSGALEELPPRRPAVLPRGGIAWLAAALVLLALAGGLWRLPATGAPVAPYRLENIIGQPRVDGELAPEVLRYGQRIECDGQSRARLAIGAIGTVELGLGTSLRLVEPTAQAATRGAEFLLDLERGQILASIFAAPRLFQVGTPAGLAVDMGCVYRATVTADGRTVLGVDSGLVAFETEVRRIVVPAGASAVADPATGPETPLWDDAPRALADAVARLDAGAGAVDELLALLADSGGEPTLVLWHLVGHPRVELRAPAYEALAALVPPPASVTRERCLAADREALDAWRTSLDWSW